MRPRRHWPATCTGSSCEVHRSAGLAWHLRLLRQCRKRLRVSKAFSRPSRNRAPGLPDLLAPESKALNTFVEGHGVLGRAQMACTATRQLVPKLIGVLTSTTVHAGRHKRRSGFSDRGPSWSKYTSRLHTSNLRVEKFHQVDEHSCREVPATMRRTSLCGRSHVDMWCGHTATRR
jgi:hypothetical protein